MVFSEMFKKGVERNDQAQVNQAGQEGVAPQNSETPTPQEVNTTEFPNAETQNEKVDLSPIQGGGAPQKETGSNDNLNLDQGSGSQDPSPQSTEGDGGVSQVGEPTVSTESVGAGGNQPENPEGGALQQEDGVEENPLDLNIDPKASPDSTEAGVNQPKDSEEDSLDSSETYGDTNAASESGNGVGEEPGSTVVHKQKFPERSQDNPNQQSKSEAGDVGEDSVISEEPAGLDENAEERVDEVVEKRPADGEKNKDGDVLENSKDKRSEGKAENNENGVDLQTVIEKINDLEKQKKIKQEEVDELDKVISELNGAREKLEAAQEEVAGVLKRVSSDPESQTT